MQKTPRKSTNLPRIAKNKKIYFMTKNIRNDGVVNLPENADAVIKSRPCKQYTNWGDNDVVAVSIL